MESSVLPEPMVLQQPADSSSLSSSAIPSITAAAPEIIRQAVVVEKAASVAPSVVVTSQEGQLESQLVSTTTPEVAGGHDATFMTVVQEEEIQVRTSHLQGG